MLKNIADNFDGILEKMSKRTKEIIAVVFFIVVLVIVFAVFASSSTDEKEKLYGTWQNTAGQNEVYEFAPNGAVVLSNDKVNFSGKYTADNEKLHVQLADREADCTYYFEDGFLYITNENGKKSRLKRVDDDIVIHTVSGSEASGTESEPEGVLHPETESGDTNSEQITEE